jgi:hypothetical protein
VDVLKTVLDKATLPLVESACDFGREVASDRGRRPRRDDARAYATLAQSATHLLVLSVLPPLRSEVPEAP